MDDMKTTTNTEPRIVTLSSDRGLSDMPVRVTEYRLLQLAPTVAGEERGAWMARHWLDCGYTAIEGEAITAETVRKHVNRPPPPPRISPPSPRAFRVRST